MVTAILITNYAEIFRFVFSFLITRCVNLPLKCFIITPFLFPKLPPEFRLLSFTLVAIRAS